MSIQKTDTVKQLLGKLETNQIEIHIGDEEANVLKITLCDSALKDLLRILHEDFLIDDETLADVCPQLKDISPIDFILRLIDGESLEISDIIDDSVREDDGPKDVASNPRVGDKLVATRTVTSVIHPYGGQKRVHFKNEDGTIGDSSLNAWKQYAKKCRKVR